MNDEELALNIYKIYLNVPIEDKRVKFYDDTTRKHWLRIARTIADNYLPFFVMGGT